MRKLEKKYANELAVVGVHSAKFPNEKDIANLDSAVRRYQLEHPVINDANMTVWRKFGVSSWPTLVLIDPEGHYVGQQPGEGNRELFDKLIGMLVDYHSKKGTLDRSPVRFDLESNRLKPGPLKFPGKVLADTKGGRLFISDTNHNRIVVTGLDGTLKEIIGSGAIGPQAASTSALALLSSCPVGWRWCHDIGSERYCRVTAFRLWACMRYCMIPAPRRRATMPTARSSATTRWA